MDRSAPAGWVSPGTAAIPPFRLAPVGDVEAALAALRADAGRPLLLAGGTDLVARFREGLQPTTVIPIGRLPELAGIALEGGNLAIGAAVTHAAGSRDPLVRNTLPGFASAWARIANVRVRLHATIGGNLMARQPRYEMALLAGALDAELEFTSGKASVSDLWAGTAPKGAILKRVVIRDAANRQLIYDRSFRPLLTVAVGIYQGDAQVWVGSEFHAPVRLTPDTIEALPDSCGDAMGSAGYRRRLVKTLVGRALA